MAKLDEKLDKFNFSKDKREEINQDINNIINSFNKLIDSYTKEIKEDIIKPEPQKRLGEDMSKEDVDKMLIIHNGATSTDLATWSIDDKIKKVVKIIKENKDACDEYELAVTTRIYYLKKELIDSFKDEIVTQIRSAVKDNTKEYIKPVAQKREELSQTTDYQDNKEALEQAKADKAIREIRKKRAAKRKTAYTAVAKAAVSAVIDNCVDETKQNIIAQYDNSVSLAKASQKELLKDNKTPETKVAHYQELEEDVLEALETDSYQLPEVTVDSDKGNNSEEELHNDQQPHSKAESHNEQESLSEEETQLHELDKNPTTSEDNSTNGHSTNEKVQELVFAGSN